MSKAIHHNGARSYKWTIAALEMGVKHLADQVCLNEPLRQSGGCGISHAKNEIHKDNECGQ
jgi:hypothetical protein